MPRHQQGRVILHEEYSLSRWNNGAGETREIARYPETGEFDWRVSMATVSTAAEFSSFPGIERWLGVGAGDALAVTIGGVEREIGIGGEPLRFSGSDAAAAHPLGSTVTDVNLMVRSGPVKGELTRLGSGTRRFDHGELLVISLVDQLTLRVSSADADPFEVDLGHLDTWRLRISEPIAIDAVGVVAGMALAYAAQVWPCAPGSNHHSFARPSGTQETV